MKKWKTSSFKKVHALLIGRQMSLTSRTMYRAIGVGYLETSGAALRESKGAVMPKKKA